MSARLTRAATVALQHLDATQRRRRLRAVAVPGARLMMADGRELIDASSNDSLGLAQHPALIAGATAWAQHYGVGARASRLVTGTLGAVIELEERLAAFFGREAALLFPSGYQANAAVLATLFELGGGRAARAFTDRLDHASLHAGCAIGGVREQRWRHNDLAHLAQLLAGDERPTPPFLIAETVFSMEGDRADVAALATLAQQHDALLYLDEAHAGGALGRGGRGLAFDNPATAANTLILATLGKAFGAGGACVAGTRPLIDFLISRCAGFIYSTALAPPTCGAIAAALDLMPDLDAERALLAARGAALRQRLAQLGIDTLASSTHIVPAVLGSEDRALSAQRQLEQLGVLAIAIRPPTVPAGSSRLRFSLSAASSDADFATLLDAVAVLAT